MWFKCISCTLLVLFYSLLASGVFKQNFYWRDFIPGYMPPDAFEASVDGKYIGQIFLDGFLPVSIDPNVGVAIVEQRGRKYIKENIKIFCTPEPDRFYWEHINLHAQPGKQMKNVVRGGYEKYYSLFIGKVFADMEWKIGRVVPYVDSNPGLRVWNKEGRFINATELDFYILKYNSTVPETKCSIDQKIRIDNDTENAHVDQNSTRANIKHPLVLVNLTLNE